MIRAILTGTEFIGLVNLGNSNEFSLFEFVNTVIKLTGSSFKIVYMTLPRDNLKCQ